MSGLYSFNCNCTLSRINLMQDVRISELEHLDWKLSGIARNVSIWGHKSKKFGNHCSRFLQCCSNWSFISGEHLTGNFFKSQIQCLDRAAAESDSSSLKHPQWTESCLWSAHFSSGLFKVFDKKKTVGNSLRVFTEPGRWIMNKTTGSELTLQQPPLQKHANYQFNPVT